MPASRGKVGPASRSPQAAGKANHFERRSTAILGRVPLMAIRSTFPAAAGGLFFRCRALRFLRHDMMACEPEGSDA